MFQVLGISNSGNFDHELPQSSLTCVHSSAFRSDSVYIFEIHHPVDGLYLTHGYDLTRPLNILADVKVAGYLNDIKLAHCHFL